MLTRMLAERRADGRPLASLRASEAVIYGRFGFGVAGEATEVTVRVRDARPVRTGRVGSVRLLPADEVLTVVPPLYERIRSCRVGTVNRPEWMWRWYLEHALDRSKASFVAVHTGSGGEDDGFAHYTVEWADDGTGKGEVSDLWGADPAVERALWAYLLEVDLVREWKLEERPLDDPIRFAVRDQRGYRVTGRWDEQWVRLLDVDTCLRARTYLPSTAAVSIGVVDPQFPDNTGVWRVSAQGAERTDESPDLEAGVAAVSAAYLGGTSWWELAAAGLVEERRPGSVGEADGLFASRPLPFCGSFF
jgi:predicted acetyltransferase